MKDWAQSSVYVPPHQRLRSVITVPSSTSINDAHSPARSTSIDNHQGLTSIPNPNFDARISPNNHNQGSAAAAGGGYFQFNQQRNLSPSSPNQHQNGNVNWNSESFHYKFYNRPKNYLFNGDRQLTHSQPKSGVVDEVSEEGSDREFGEFEPSSYPSGVSTL